MKSHLVEVWVIFHTLKTLCCVLLVLGSNVPGAVVFTAPTFEALQKEAKESLEFHIEGLVENGEDVPEWLKNGDYEFEYNIIR